MTSTTNALSAQLNNAYIKQSSAEILSRKKTHDSINENIFYRPSAQNTIANIMKPEPIASDRLKLSVSPYTNPENNLTSARSSSLVVNKNISHHNPITNPLPTTYNPYILKQLNSFTKIVPDRIAEIPKA